MACLSFMGPGRWSSRTMSPKPSGHLSDRRWSSASQFVDPKTTQPIPPWGRGRAILALPGGGQDSMRGNIVVSPFVVALACAVAACGGGTTAASDVDVREADGTRDGDAGADLDLVAGDVADVDGGDPAETVVPCVPVDWVAIPGGTFQMGAADLDCDGNGLACAAPVHAVTVPSFRMTRTEVTVCEYAECVSAGKCTASSPACAPPGENQPAGCLGWDQSKEFCEAVGGRLCSEAEWEYAARNGSSDSTYPWGESPTTCDLAACSPCGQDSLPSCSMPAGNDSWGICDLLGNLNEWVGDCWQDSFDGAPADGSARQDCSARESPVHLFKGDGFNTGCGALRASRRWYQFASVGGDYTFGARCCRRP